MLSVKFYLLNRTQQDRTRMGRIPISPVSRDVAEERIEAKQDW
jgi:hypothetical protein